MIFQTNLMLDPVVASDGFTYERQSIEQWMEGNNTSPTTREPLDNKSLIPNHAMRKQIAAWCEQNGVSVPQPPKRAAKPAAAGGGAAVEPLLQKPVVTCQRHPKEKLRVFCVDCDCGVCFNCAVDSGICKAHTTKAFDPLLEELETDREGWARAQRECDEGVEQLCADIQADGDTKVQAIAAEVLQLQQQARSAAAARSAAIGAILLKRQERAELVAGATASPEIAVKGSAAAAVVVSALHRSRAPIPPASAAEFRAAAAPAAAVGQVIVAAAVVDPEDEAARAAAAAAAAAAAEAAAAAAALGPLIGSSLLGRVGDRNKVQQFTALLRTKLPGKRYRLLYTWSRDGRSNASFHERCDNQVRAIARLFRFIFSRCRAGTDADHRALHERIHLRRLRSCSMEQY
jgi:hypothetical protein